MHAPPAADAASEPLTDAALMRRTYPDRVPVVITLHASCTHDLSRRRYLVPKNATVADLHVVLRRRLQLRSSESLFLFALTPRGRRLLDLRTSIAVIDDECCAGGGDGDGDGEYLTVCVAMENVFGADAAAA